MRSDGTEAVLKLGVPNRELRSEIEALALYRGIGCAQLLEADAEGGAILLERLRPGDSLRTLAFEDDVAATAIMADVMRSLWRPAPQHHAMLMIADWAQGLEALRPTYGGGTGPFPAHLVDAAHHLFAELIVSSAAPVVLHGDLHHDNVLATGGGWLAIDPKGVVGEREFEVYALLRNPYGWAARQSDLRRELIRRLDQLSEQLDLDRDRMRLWSVAQCVLSAWWDVNADNPNGNQVDLHIADILLHSS
jgi:streptomycin 6-kinase